LRCELAKSLPGQVNSLAPMMHPASAGFAKPPDKGVLSDFFLIAALTAAIPISAAGLAARKMQSCQLSESLPGDIWPAIRIKLAQEAAA